MRIFTHGAADAALLQNKAAWANLQTAQLRQSACTALDLSRKAEKEWEKKFVLLSCFYTPLTAHFI